MERTQNQKTNSTRGRVVLLNALPLNALDAFNANVHLEVTRIPIDAISAWVNERLAEGYTLTHYIRHPATIQVLRELGIPLGMPSTDLYRYRNGDILVVITLSSPQRGQEVQVRPEDLAVWIVRII